MYKYTIIFLVSLIFSEGKIYEFTEEEVDIFQSSIIELEQKDSLNVLIIKSLENQVFNFEHHIKNDSLIINQLELKNRLQSELVSLVKPRWYENKYLWFFGGFFSFYLATKTVDNLN